ncbi:TPA: hypothetical protein ACNBL0_004529 [Escherichia coli]
MNSLTANNRLSQQLVVSVAEHLLLRHECRLPNLLAVSNHRELYLTVQGMFYVLAWLTVNARR